MLSDSPPERDLEWTDVGVASAHRFINKIWETCIKAKNYKNHEDIGYELLKELQNEDLSNYYFDNLLSKKNEILDKTDF